MTLTRREFVTGCCAGIAALAGTRVDSLAFGDAKDTSRRDLLVVIFLRGGFDGLSLVAPTDDRSYVAARGGDLRVANRGDHAGLPLNNALAPLDFRLHPKAAPLRELYDSKALAIVHACGLTNGTRSHFDAMDLMERGTPDHSQKSLSSGWLTRHLTTTRPDGVFPAVGIGGIPDSLLGSTQAVGMSDVGSFGLWADAGVETALRRIYSDGSALHVAGSTTLRALEVLAKKMPVDQAGNALPYLPEKGVAYPATGLSASLQAVAQLIKMDLGLQVATLDYGGWDTHQAQASIFPSLVEELSAALAAFYNDLPRHRNRLTVVVMSEFGRRLKPNESGGTDHGHGNVMLVLGGNVNGGRMYGAWPGLATEQLDNGVDLAVTTDYRTVLSEIVVRRLANPEIGKVFPGYGAYKPLSLVRGPDLRVR